MKELQPISVTNRKHLHNHNTQFTQHVHNVIQKDGEERGRMGRRVRRDGEESEEGWGGVFEEGWGGVHVCDEGIGYTHVHTNI